jgi:Tfp pilus assembly protein PilO
MNMKRPDRQQVMIITVAVIMAAGFAVGRYMPLAKRKAEVRQAKADAMMRVDSLTTKSSQLSGMREKVLALADDLAKYDMQVPEGRNFAGLWQQIADVMNAHGLTDQLIQPADEIRGESINCIPLSLQCSGDLSEIYEMFNSLGELDRLIRIEHVQLLNDNDYSGNVKMQAKANVYYRPIRTESI